MSLFYDPHDGADQKRVEAILRENGILYELHPEPVTGKGPMQIFVADKDMAMAENLIVHLSRH